MNVVTRHALWWALYDLANTMVETNAALYASTLLITDLHVSPIAFSAVAAASAILLLLTLPPIGAFADARNAHIPLLLGFTLASAVLVGAFGWSAGSTERSPAHIARTLSLFAVGTYFFQLAVAMYNALLRHRIAPDEALGRVAAFGTALSYAGAIIGVVIVLPFADGRITLFGIPGKSQVFVPTATLFLTIGMLSIVQMARTAPAAPKRAPTLVIPHDRPEPVRSSSFAWLAVSLFLYSAAVVTFGLFLSVFLDNVLGVTEGLRSLIFVVILVAASAGALASGKFFDRSQPKRALVWALALWGAALALVSAAHGLLWTLIALALYGLGFGAVSALGRPFFALAVPRPSQGQYFGMFVGIQRAAAAAGPLIWSAILGLFAFAGTIRYRLANLALALFIAIAIAALRGVADPQPEDGEAL